MLWFANDIAIVTENENNLQNVLQRMNNIMRKEFNIEIKKKKLKILIRSWKEEDRLRTTTASIENELL